MRRRRTAQIGLENNEQTLMKFSWSIYFNWMDCISQKFSQGISTGLPMICFFQSYWKFYF